MKRPLSPFLSRTSSVSLAVGCLFGVGCETLIDANFDRQFRASQACLPACPVDTRCDLTRSVCVCAPAACPEGACGTLLDSRCGQPIDCGECQAGQHCGSETPNVCSNDPCTPQTCEQLGQTTGVHPSCGILVDCNPKLDCICGPDEVCLAGGCCPAFKPAEGLCGFLENGCGQQQLRECTAEAELVCHEGTCCNPADACNGTCGPTAACGGYIDCFGDCTQEGQECQRVDGPFPPHHRCQTCSPRCPEEPKCGLNEDQGCPGESILCPGSCPEGQVCKSETFSCCEPQCPGMPTACGANPDGCGRTIQCPGPCPLGQSCRAGDDGSFACTP